MLCSTFCTCGLQNQDNSYLFHSHGTTVVEIKRLDVADNAEPCEKFFWFLIRENSEVAERLTIVEVDSEDEIEYRQFKEGEFQFDATMGELLLNDENGLALDRISAKKITRKTWEKILSYFETYN